MICSAKELGLNDKLLPKDQQEGILVLPGDLAVGTPIGLALGIDDEVLELDLTPNRSDCLSMLGVAYEAGALTGRPVKLPDNQLNDAVIKTSDHVQVSISAPGQCHRYTARYVQGVVVGPSPQWMQNRLMAAGVRPINNIVDITNYVMLEYGQPLHAFDADKLAGGRIDVRMARPGETIVTLDDQERKLEPHMLLIADGEKPVALAGVMGGANTEVTESTVNILLESAKFDGGTVRKTSRQLGLRSESSIRFEKGVDHARVVPALDRAAALMARYASGLAAEGYVEAVSVTEQPVDVAVTLEKINALLGTDLSSLEVKTIFERLGFGYEASQDGSFNVRVPSRRGDITRAVDLIEEVARLYGYDEITTPGALTTAQAIRRGIRGKLTDAGLTEAFSYSLTHPARTQLFRTLAEDAQPIRLAMPMSEDRSVLRTSLLPNLLEVAVYNRNRRIDDLALFEIGSVFLTDEATLTRLPQEKHRLAGLLTGNRRASQWNVKAEAVDFYDAKGVLEAIFELLGITDRIAYRSQAIDQLHPGRTAAVLLDTERGWESIGYVGQLHPTLQQQEDLADTFVFEIELAPLYEHADFAIVQKPLPRYPAIERDIAVVVESGIEAAKLTSEITSAAGELLESVRVFDVFTGEKVGKDKKSVAVALVYRHAERTLTDEEVTERHSAVVDRLSQTFGAELRK
jgi:phenylalanyl-tRNA synthetase beta chain